MKFFQKIFLLLIFQLLPFCFLFAQKNLEKGNMLFDMNLFEEAAVFFQKEIDAGKSKELKDESMQQLANCYRLLGRFEEAEEMYKAIFKIRKRDPVNVLNYAHALKSSAKYAEALDEYIQYSKMNPDDPMGEIYVESCRLAQQWLDESQKVEVRNFSSANSGSPDFAAVFFENGIVFCSSREGSKKKIISVNGKNDEVLLDFYYTEIHNEESAPAPLVDLNSFLHEGPASFSRNGKKVYFTRTIEGKRDKEKNIILSTLQIFFSERDSTGRWSKPVSALPFNSTEYSVGQPSLSTDEKTLYFMSDMPGGIGGTDIYLSNKKENGEWGPPQNLGNQVNTFGYELFPSINSDGILYFSSNTHPGMGKLDIFSIQNVKGNWVNLQNLKPPVNSIADDFACVLENDHRRGFFSSNRFNGIGSDDIYSFIEMEPPRLSFDGMILSIEDQSLFDAVKYKLVNDQNEEQPAEVENSRYKFRLGFDVGYTLVTRKEGFSFNKIKIKVTNDYKEGQTKFELSPSMKEIMVDGILRDVSDISTTDSTKMDQIGDVISDAVVSLNKSNARIERTTTNQQGKYSLIKTLEPGGDYSIVFKGGKKKSSASEKAVNVREKADSNNIDKEKVQITGLIKSNGVILENSLVLLLKEGDVVEEAITDQTGKFLFEASPNSALTIVASKAGYFDNFIELSPSDIKEGKLENEISLLKKEMITIKGVARDDQGAPLINSPVTLSKGVTSLAKRITNEKGEFEFLALKDGDYNITITQKGYMQKDIPLTTKGENVENPMIIETSVEKISTEAKEQTLSIFYDYNSADLRAESIPALNKLIDFLKQNPSMKIEISSHTDSRGTDEYNLSLSQKRAESVVLFLYFDGEISKERMSAKGYGETKLTNHCKNGVQCSEEEHAKNRRTELKVLSY